MDDYMYNILPDDDHEYDRLKSFLSMFDFRNIKSIQTYFDEDTNTYEIKLVYNYYMNEPFHKFYIDDNKNKIEFLINKYLEIPSDRFTIETEISEKH
jgi:hypothetical protein